MDLLTWLAVGLFATILSGALLLTEIDEVFFALPAVLSWLIVAFGATNLRRITETGEVVQLEYLQLALLAGGMAMLMLLVWVRGAATMLVPRDQDEPYVSDGASDGLGPKP